jgi:serine/threonine-protein phosphatase 2B regulatory subunit
MAASKRASREDRLRLIFAVFDVDGDGRVSPEDLELMVRQLAGSSLACARAPLPAAFSTAPTC